MYQEFSHAGSPQLTTSCFVTIQTYKRPQIGTYGSNSMAAQPGGHTIAFTTPTFT